MMQRMCLFLVLFVALVQPLVAFQTRAIDVVSASPHHIKFTLSVDCAFVPIRLTTIPNAWATSVEFEVVFTNATIKSLQNKSPLNFYKNDVITLLLEYSACPSSSYQFAYRKELEFVYQHTDTSIHVLYVTIDDNDSELEKRRHLDLISHAALLPADVHETPGVQHLQEAHSEDNEENAEQTCLYDYTELTKLLKETLMHGGFSTTLILTPKTKLSGNINAVDYIRAILVHQLDLWHLENRILQATVRDGDVLFEMETSSDTLEVLLAANLNFNQHKFNIKFSKDTVYAENSELDCEISRVESQ